MLEESPCPKAFSRDRFILKVMGLDLPIFELVVHEQMF